MAKHLARDLDALNTRLVALGREVEEALYGATQAMQARDTDRAKKVIAADDAIDEQENDLQEECLKLLALHQPVAVDLRRITAVLHITTDLERIGDLAVEIAERALSLPPHPGAPTPAAIARLTDTVAGMLRQSLDAFVALDVKAAARVIRQDDEADRLSVEVIAELVTRMKANPEAVEACVSLFSVARQLERVGDHATNIAEDVVYLVEGEVVRHRPEAAALHTS